MTDDIAKLLVTIPELGHVSVRPGQLTYTPPLINVLSRRALPALAYLKTYASVRAFEGDFFLCLYDGWREYSAPFSSPVFVPWIDVDQSRYLGIGSEGEPRFMHRYQDGVFPVMPLPVLAFNRHSGDTNTWLLPDPLFLTDQFNGITSQVAAHDVDWDVKDGSKLYWRGSRWRVKSFNEMPPRDFVTSINDRRIDASFSRGEVSWNEYLRNKYLLDIDGFVSSWPGLFWKLRSNSVPVKLASHWEQWYYYKLVNGTHLVITDRDSLLQTQNLLSHDDARASLIAQNGQCLSRGLTYAFAVEEYTIG